MRSTSTTARSAASRRARLLLILPTAVALALAGCAQGGPAAEPSPQETTVQSTPESSATPSAAPSAVPSGVPSAVPSTTPSATPPTDTPGTPAPPAASGTSALLTVSMRQDASAEPVQYTLECLDGAPGPATTLPNADAACGALTRLGTQFFTARPNKDVICTQQYGGPQTASITGELNGTQILASFALTDGCEISRWNSVADILGTAGAQ